MQEVVEATGLSKVFGKDVRAVDGVSFAVSAGEIFGFLGPNGAGKTTTINMLTTQLRPTAGSARVAGYDVVRHPNEVRKRISVVPQNSTTDEELTCRENVQVIANLYGMDKRESGPVVQDVLGLVELTKDADRLVREFSGGMKRRLEIACGLVNRPQVLFLDEPTLGLDTQTREAVWRYLRVLRQRFSMTVFMTTHHLEEADQICDRVGIIDHGKMVSIGTPNEIKKAVGGDVIDLTIDVGSDEISNAISQSSGGHVERAGANYRIKVSDGEEAIPAVIELVRSKGYKVSRVSLSKPSLAEAYLELTGREFREGDVDAEQNAHMMRLIG